MAIIAVIVFLLVILTAGLSMVAYAYSNPETKFGAAIKSLFEEPQKVKSPEKKEIVCGADDWPNTQEFLKAKVIDTIKKYNPDINFSIVNVAETESGQISRTVAVLIKITGSSAFATPMKLIYSIDPAKKDCIWEVDPESATINPEALSDLKDAPRAKECDPALSNISDDDILKLVKEDFQKKNGKEISVVLNKIVTDPEKEMLGPKSAQVMRKVDMAFIAGSYDYRSFMLSFGERGTCSWYVSDSGTRTGAADISVIFAVEQTKIKIDNLVFDMPRVLVEPPALPSSSNPIVQKTAEAMATAQWAALQAKGPLPATGSAHVFKQEIPGSTKVSLFASSSFRPRLPNDYALWISVGGGAPSNTWREVASFYAFTESRTGTVPLYIYTLAPHRAQVSLGKPLAGRSAVATVFVLR